jgi:hypothetical protein
MVFGLMVLWLSIANATCERSRGGEELTASYRLARFQLIECQEMGAGDLDSESLNKGLILSKAIEENLAKGSWNRAGTEISQLEDIVALLVHRMKRWDPDDDGLSNYAEYILYGTSWSSKDSDGDGYLDGSEILRHETDPLDHCAAPIDVPVETQIVRSCPALEKLRSDN